MSMILAKILLYGHLGLLIEIWFTSLHSIFFKKDARAPGRTYLWMIAIYGFGGLSLGMLRDFLSSSWVFIPVAVCYIFAMEFISGWLIEKLIGKCPWDYGQARFGIAGLVRLDYLPFWLGVAIGFDLLADKIVDVIEASGRIVQ